MSYLGGGWNPENSAILKMKTKPNLLAYPVLCMPWDLGIFTAKNASELEHSQGVLLWKSRLYEGLKIIDASGQAYVVIRTTVRKPRSTMGRWLAKYLDLSVHLSLDLEDCGPASLQEIESAVSASIKDDPEALERLSGKSVDWWGLVLAESANIMDVLKAINEPVST